MCVCVCVCVRVLEHKEKRVLEITRKEQTPNVCVCVRVCTQVMDWCARQGLAEPRAAATGRFGSYPEWSRAVNARRARAAPRPLFLDSLLQVGGGGGGC